MKAAGIIRLLYGDNVTTQRIKHPVVYLEHTMSELNEFVKLCTIVISNSINSLSLYIFLINLKFSNLQSTSIHMTQPIENR